MPTFVEAGVKNYQLDIWYGLMAPAKTPSSILGTIHDEVKRFISLPETRKRLAEIGVEELTTSRAEHGKVLNGDLEKYAQLIKSLKLTPAN